MTTIFNLQDVSQSSNLELFSSLKTRVDQASFLTAMDFTVEEMRLIGSNLQWNEGSEETLQKQYIFAGTNINRIIWLSHRIICLSEDFCSVIQANEREIHET